MINYLLNATIIWLLCLVVYDLLLRKETYHACNRVYLNTSMIAGLLLPLWHWDSNTSITNPVLRQPAEQAYVIRKSITSAAPATHSALELYSIMWVVYLIGVAFFTAMIIKDIVQLFKYYKQGTHERSNGFTIIETGKEHSAFSMFKFIFIRSRAEFNDEQWALLLSHEMQHGKLRHSIDKCFALLLRTVLWFHPIVYVYYKRLMIVHEYQADVPAKDQLKTYGNFLLEQSMLQQAPIIVHSFNYSPLKNRIHMLTRKRSSKIKLAKYLVTVPLLFLLVLCCTNIGFSAGKEKKGNKIYFKGNTFELKGPHTDTVEVYNPATNESQLVITQKDSMIDKMNGEKVFDEMSVTAIPKYIGKKSLDELLVEKLHTELNTLSDGDYRIKIGDLVIDSKGKLVYYNSDFSLYNTDGKSADPKIPDDVRKEMKRKIEELLDSPLPFSPATQEGKKVTSFTYPIMSYNYLIRVKDHIASLINTQ